MRGFQQNRRLLDVRDLASTQCWKRLRIDLKEFCDVGIAERQGSEIRQVQSMRSTDLVTGAGNVLEYNTARLSRSATRAGQVSCDYLVTVDWARPDPGGMTSY